MHAKENAMALLTSVPAVRQVATDRPELYAFDLVGDISPADIENFYGLLEAAYALHPAIDVLVRAIDEKGLDLANTSRETLAEGSRHAGEHVRRCALVGNMRAVPEIGRFFTSSGEVRKFARTEEDAAWTWIGGRPIEGA
jgi:hypothetical protein